jgi:hypothetical protein
VSRELAVPDGGDLSDPDVARTLAKLRAAREYVRGCPEDEALKARRDAETVRHWARINKASGEIALEACRLQATAMRRLAQLGSAHIAGMGRAASEWLGSLDDEDFAEVIDGTRYAKSPVTLYNEHCKREAAADAYRRGQEIAGGGGERAEFESLTRAASTVLHAAMEEGATTVGELTEELARQLDVSLDDHGHGGWAVREGVESVIREALRSENISSEAHPDFVTWKDREAGWLRIPWPAATLDQLRWMAEFREEQARELAEAAETLRILVRDLDAIRAGNRHLARLNDLWAALQAALAADDEAA